MSPLLLVPLANICGMLPIGRHSASLCPSVTWGLVQPCVNAMMGQVEAAVSKAPRADSRVGIRESAKTCGRRGWLS